MDKKKYLIPVLAAALAVVLLVLFLRPEGENVPSAGTTGPRPSAQSQSGSQSTPTEPGQTTAPVQIWTEPGEATLPPQTLPEQTEPAVTEPAETQPTLQRPKLFPLELEDGDLTVHSLFQFSGMNPDVQNLFGEDIAGIQMTNTSGEHMTFAEITAVMADGTTLTFRAEDVPAGETVMAFCLEHTSVADPADCEEVFGYAEFEPGDMLRTDLVELSVVGTSITVTNVSGENLKDLKIICHGLLDSSLFGGTTYQYQVSTLPAGGSTVVQAVDCILGMTGVVRVELGS